MSSCDDPLALCKTSIKERFWLDDYTDLYKNNKYLTFIPKYEMTREQQLNAMTRFCLYFAILAFAFNRSAEWLYLPIAILVLIIILFFANKKDVNGKENDLKKILGIRSTKRDVENMQVVEEYKHDGDEIPPTLPDGSNPDYRDIDFICPDPPKGYEIETGYYDSDGDLITGPKERVPTYYKYPAKSLYTIDELRDYTKNTCRRPTANNPFMNPDVTEYNSDPPAACNADDDDIKESIKVNFNKDLFRDVDELWEKENSQRQFYTLPNTQVPNNQKDFAEWLYKIPATCKEDQQGCLRYEDLRFKSQI